jgi:hypothetical protein
VDAVVPVTALTAPLKEPMEDVPEIAQVPPVTTSLKSMEEPEHTLPAPKIGPGKGLTVMVSLTKHPVARR